MEYIERNRTEEIKGVIPYLFSTSQIRNGNILGKQFSYAMRQLDSAALHLAVGLSPNKSKIKTDRKCINALQPVLFYPYSACSLTKVSL